TGGIHVFNPQVQSHGWQSSHTIIQLLHVDSPFLVDSVRIELNRQGFAIHTLQNSTFKADRDADGRLQALHPVAAKGEGLRAESVMHIEVDRCPTPAGLKALQTGLQEVFTHVETAVSAFEPMRQQVRELRDQLADGESAWFDGESQQEAAAFLDWLLELFIFLGYTRFSFREGYREGRLGMQLEHSLGLAALEPPDDYIEGLPEAVLEYMRSPQLLSFAKGAQNSRVH